MLEILAPPARILLMAAFLVFAKMGWLSWIRPDNAEEIANRVMDFLVVAVPAAYALWAGFKAWREKRARKRAARPENVIAAAAALPEVAKVEVKSEALALSIPSGKVVS